ncbi:aspartate/glutamate racemase family protein [Streptococcus ovis]|uniref:aspartate/glutamate racemase family protein n=1 Tax=Streptococcus ovis TaxID=82806 RepID=UPI000370B752|nr:amino acid racemase [Streptococcus ovis]
MKKKMTIGVLGGMGTFATIHFFQQYASVFKAEKEWERPRIIIDNRCTMPSRVRAFLYDENTDQLVDEMVDSIKSLVNAGADKIILACNTSHIFIPKIEEKFPQAKGMIINIIENCSQKILEDSIDEVYLLGSEGTIESGVYQTILEESGIRCLVPEEEQYKILRDCIEAVKQHSYSEDIESKFLSLINANSICILGCTELPILYERYFDKISCEKVYDPLLLVLDKLKEEFINE